MNELTIKMNIAHMPGATVVANGTEVKFKKKDGGLYEGTVPVEESACTLEIFSYSEYGGKLWWLYSLLFFIVSCFGIFDVPYGDGTRIRYKTTLTLSANSEVNIRFNPSIVGKKAVELTTSANSEEESNEYYEDEQIKKRRKIMKIVKALTWVAIIVGGIVGGICWAILR